MDLDLLDLTDCGVRLHFDETWQVKKIRICGLLSFSRTGDAQQGKLPILLRVVKFQALFLGDRIRIHNRYANPDLGHSPKRMPIYAGPDPDP